MQAEKTAATGLRYALFSVIGESITQSSVIVWFSAVASWENRRALKRER